MGAEVEEDLSRANVDDRSARRPPAVAGELDDERSKRRLLFERREQPFLVRAPEVPSQARAHGEHAAKL